MWNRMKKEVAILFIALIDIKNEFEVITTATERKNWE